MTAGHAARQATHPRPIPISTDADAMTRFPGLTGRDLGASLIAGSAPIDLTRLLAPGLREIG